MPPTTLVPVTVVTVGAVGTTAAGEVIVVAVADNAPSPFEL